MLDRLDVASKLVRNHNARLAETCDHTLQKAPGRLRITMLLNKNVESIAVGINRPPEPILHTLDRDNDLVEMPLVGSARSIPFNTTSEMATKTVNLILSP